MRFIALLLAILFATRIDESESYQEIVLDPLFQIPVNASTLKYNCCDLQSMLSSQTDSGTPVNEGKVSELLVFWGKLVAHDISRFASEIQPIGPQNNCSALASDDGNSTKSLVTPALDAGFVYGDDDEMARQFRENNGALCELRLVDGDIPKQCNPIGSTDKFHNVNNTAADVPCTADPRASESLQMLALQTLLVNEHNRLCKSERKKLKGKPEDVIFAKTRRRLIALVQKISLYEWLPALTNRFPEEATIPKYSIYQDAMRIPAFHDVKHAIAPGATSRVEITRALFRIFDYMHGHKVTFVDPTMRVLEIPFLEGVFEPDNMYAGFANGHRTYCDVIYGMMQTPAGRLGPTNTPDKACAGANMTTFMALQNTILSNFSALPFRDVGELQKIVSLTDITDSPIYIDFLQTLYGSGDIASSVDLLLGFLVETHGPIEKDIIGPLARFLFVLQMTSFTRDFDTMWYERVLSKDVIDHINNEDGIFHLVQRHCPRFVNTKKFNSPFHTIQHEASESLYTGTTVDGNNGVFSTGSSSSSSQSSFTTTANTTSLILFICIIAILTIILFVLLFYVLRQNDNKKKA